MPHFDGVVDEEELLRFQTMSQPKKWADRALQILESGKNLMYRCGYCTTTKRRGLTNFNGHRWRDHCVPAYESAPKYAIR